MNFWTFLDRNGFGLSILVIICLCFGFGTCGAGHGCRARLGPASVETGPTDGGAP